MIFNCHICITVLNYTVYILDEGDISDSDPTTSVVIAEVEKIELLEKKSKEVKTLEQLMFPDDCFDETLKDKNNVKSDGRIEKREGKLKGKSKRPLISKTNVQTVHKCSICDYKTALKPHLKRHIESVHQGIKPFKCTLCEYEGSVKLSLEKHIESVHEGIKPFKCSICDFKTAFEPHLKRHIESLHQGVKPFKCNICDYETAQNSNLKRHIERVHEAIKKLRKLRKSFTCDFPDCGKTFFGNNSKRSYENHKKKHLVSKVKKKLESKCDFCNKEYKDLKKHKKGYCLENRDTRKLSDIDIKDPLFIMPKPPIELDWSWRDKLKKEKMAKVKPSSYIISVTNSTNKETIVVLPEANKTLQEQPNIPPGIKNDSNEQQESVEKVKTSSNLDEEKTKVSTQESKTLQKSNIPPAPRIKIEFEKSSNVVIGKIVIGE